MSKTPDDEPTPWSSVTAGERHRRYREACGLTRARWSALCGVSEIELKTYETGRRVMAQGKAEVLERRLKRILVELPSGAG